MAVNKRKIQEVNAGSMADIAFLLLIFFLVATTMNVDTGLQRTLPAMPPEDQEEKPMDVNERNVLRVFISGNDKILVKNQEKDITQIKDLAREFIENRANDPSMPDKLDTDIPHIGVYPVSRGIISLQNHRGTSYRTYIMVQNELTRAFNEMRNELAMDKFGVAFMDLSPQLRLAVQEAIPLKVSEAEPRDNEAAGGQ